MFIFWVSVRQDVPQYLKDKRSKQKRNVNAPNLAAHLLGPRGSKLAGLGANATTNTFLELPQLPPSPGQAPRGFLGHHSSPSFYMAFQRHVSRYPDTLGPKRLPDSSVI